MEATGWILWLQLSVTVASPSGEVLQSVAGPVERERSRMIYATQQACEDVVAFKRRLPTFTITNTKGQLVTQQATSWCTPVSGLPDGSTSRQERNRE